MKQQSRTSQLMQLARLVLLIVFYTLDVRDLCFKLVWLGSATTYAFSARISSTISAEALVPRSSSFNASQLHSGKAFPLDIASPWLAFYDRCESLHAGSDNNGVFDTFVAKNCELGTFSGQYIAPDVVFSTSVRVDSVAWASCKLLFLHRRPPLCQEPVVADFAQRMHLDDPTLRASDFARINSDAEFELLRLLELLARAQPLRDVVCVEGFQYGGGAGPYAPSLFACASPTYYEAVVAGYHAEALGRVHAGLSWLTFDRVSVLGFDYGVRQNSRVAFALDTDDATITQHADVNFSSFGHLYVLLLVVDVLLCSVYIRTAFETARVLGVPLLSDTTATPPGVSWTALYRSVYRSPLFLTLAALSVLLSWVTMLPNAAISGWDVDVGGRTHAFLTSTRVWVLVVAVLTWTWDAVVSLSEASAYAVARATHVSIAEIVAIVAGVSAAERVRVFDIATQKRALEAQRRWSHDAFVGRVAYSNAYNNALLESDAADTSANSLIVLYTPLVRIVCESLAIVVVVLAVRYVRSMQQQRSQVAAREVAQVTAEIQVIESTDDLDLSPVMEESVDETTLLDEVDFASAAYSRLPLEEQLQRPIRAHSLVRSSVALEQIVAGQQCIPPAVYFDAGLVVRNNRIRARRGFVNVIRARLAVDHAVLAAAAETAQREDATAGSPSKKMASSAKMKAVANLVFETDVPDRSFGGGSAVASVSSAPTLGDSSATGLGDKKDDSLSGRRPLAETAASAAARSMRRRKSVNEMTAIPL